MANTPITANLTPEAVTALEEIAVLTGGNHAQALNQALTAYADALRHRTVRHGGTEVTLRWSR